jgi:hypothetical protein
VSNTVLGSRMAQLDYCANCSEAVPLHHQARTLSFLFVFGEASPR